jgi:NAD(P)-dependent dehydrogenase (short-subunit alcohol dehydrogenase family)
MNFRIINISSTAQVVSQLKLEDLMGQHVSSAQGPLFTKLDVLYSNSKLAISYFTKELSMRLQGTSVTAYTVCPGLVVTELLRTMSGTKRLVLNLMLLTLGQTPTNVSRHITDINFVSMWSTPFSNNAA